MIEVQPRTSVVTVTVAEFPNATVTVTPSAQPVTVTPIFTVATGPPGADATASISPIADNQIVDDSGLYVPGTIDLGTFT